MPSAFEIRDMKFELHVFLFFEIQDIFFAKGFAGQAGGTGMFLIRA